MRPTRTHEAAGGRVEGRRAHGQPDAGALEEQEEQAHHGDQHRHHAERLHVEVHPAERHRRVREGARKAAVAEAPDPAGRAVDQQEQAERDDHEGERLAPLERTDHHALDRRARREGEGEGPEQSQAQRHARLVDAPGHERAEHGHLALGEVHDARGAEDQHERERERAVDRARGHAVDEHLYELGHQ